MIKQHWGYFIFLFFYSITHAQVVNSGDIDYTKVATISNVTRTGYTGSSYYSSTTSFNLRFGVNSNGTTAATVPVLKSFKYGTIEYVPYLKGLTPYENIKISRKENNDVKSATKFTGFFEYSNISGTTDKFFNAEYVDNLETLINSYTLNRGVDNIFSNFNSSTMNNIERIDLIRNSGMEVPTGVSLNKVGVLILERGGNDDYRLAAITKLDTNGNVSGLGSLIARARGKFGALGKSVLSTVFMNSSTVSPDPIKPNQDLTSQNIAGDFIDLETLGLTPGQVIYGIAVFPNDVTSAMDLIGLSNVPINTNGDSDGGGLDLMGGGGFAIVSTTAIVSLSGNVYRDMINNNIVDGVGIGTASGSQLYAYLINSSNKVIFKQIVNTNGSYLFSSILIDTSEDYSVAIDSRNLSINDVYPSAYSLPTGWVSMGQTYGTNNGLGSGNDSNTTLKVPVRFLTSTPFITNVNFGINLHCSKPGDFTTGGNPTNVGITNQTKLPNWPEAIPNAFITLESKADGLVLTRVQSSTAIVSPKKGMLIYDVNAACVKLYNGNIWNCIQRSCND
ncbi:hypothetical protein ACTS91_04390 [Empedobacter falsenii]|uniref:hypothetical protein n=2 Tax=Weeksellaceae TaxID=2762318 RepID=UPI0005718321|nr:hypothetical protein [Empedobacter falsenii]HAR72274.1 hypothetical protein [Flavobacteriaceae bacterium]